MMIHFIRPLWLLLWIPAFIYLIWVMYASWQRNPWKRVCDPHLLPHLLQSGKSSAKKSFYLTLFLFFTISIFALAGPSWHKDKLPIYRDVNSLMLVLDLSSVMQEADIKPNRITRAKLKIRDLINAAKNTQMGLVVFTQEGFVVTPLSQDAHTLNALLEELHPNMMPVAGSDIAEGLAQASKLLNQAAAMNSDLLLMTASAPTATSWTAAKSIAAAGHHLNVLAMLESNNVTQPTIAKLQELAEVGKGSFYLFTPNASDIQAILKHQHKQSAVKDENIENAMLWSDAGPWFCLLLIPLILIVLREKAWHEKHR